MRFVTSFSLALMMAATAACSSRNLEEPASDDNASSAATVKPFDTYDAGAITPPPGPGMTGHSLPYPCTVGGTTATNQFVGSPAELMLADALAICTMNGAGIPTGTWVSDAVLARTRLQMDLTLVKMTSADANVSSDDLDRRWLALRIDPKSNCDPVTQVATAVNYSTHPTATNLVGKYDPYYDVAHYTNSGFDGLASTAQQPLEVASVNLCIGRTLNEQLQYYGATLLMAGAEQRLLHETIRERAQIAMLQLSDIGVALSNYPSDVTMASLIAGALKGSGPSPGVGFLTQFLANGGIGPGTTAASDVAVHWANDLVDAARIEAEATERLATLLVRSGAASDVLPGASPTGPRCGAPGGACDDLSPGSWRQRALALLYGGNPLDKTGAPGAPPVVTKGSATSGLAWPSGAEIPYATHSIAAGATSPPPSWTPGAIRFLAAAQQVDALSILLNAGVSTYSDPSNVATAHSMHPAVSDAAYWLYLDVEAALESSACANVSGSYAAADSGLEDAGFTITCPTVNAATIRARGTPLPVSSTPVPNLQLLSTWQAWQTAELRPEDAQDLVNALVAMLPSTSARGGLLLTGKTDLRALPGRTTQQSLHLSPDAHLVTHSLLDTASTYARMGRHHMPQLLLDTVGTFEAVYSNLAAPGDTTVVDATRAMGVVPAFADLREALGAIGAGTNPAGQAFRAQTASLSSLVQAAIGDSQTTLLPVEQPFNVNGQTVVVQAAGPTITATGPLAGAATRQWMVRVVPSYQDAHGGFWSDPPADYSIYAIIDTPQAQNAVMDTSARNGFTPLTTILAAKDGTVQLGTDLVRTASGELSSIVSLPESLVGMATPHTVLLVAQRRVSGEHVYRYQALSGLLTPWAVRTLASDKTTTLAAPGDAQYVVGGGSLVNLAAQAGAVDPHDPATPLYDGFGNARNVLPTRVNLTASSATLAPQLWWQETLAAAQAPLADVTTNWSTFLGDLKTTTTDQIKMQQAEQTEFTSINRALVTLCGGTTGNGDGGTLSPTADGGVMANSGCDVELVTVNSMGPTASEMQAMGCTDLTGAPASIPSLTWDPGNLHCDPSQPPQTTLDTMRCALAPYANAFSFPVQVARPVACAAWKRQMTFGDGTLGVALSAQAADYWAYRDAVSALDKAASAVIMQANAADAAILASQAAYVAETKVEAANELKWSNDVKAAAKAVDDAQATLAEKMEEQAALYDKGVAGAVSPMESYTAAGAGMGAAAGPVGAVIGGAVGFVLGSILSLGGPSPEQLQQAQDAVSAAQRALTTAQQNLVAAEGEANANITADAAKAYAAYTQTLLAQAQANATEAQQVATFATQANTVYSSLATLVSSATPIRNLLTTTALDIQVARLTYSQVVQAARSDFGIMAEFDSNVTFALQASIEAARSRLIDARHLLEFTYAADFASMNGKIGNTAAPNVWIDQMYDYDLSPLRAIYGTTGGNGPVDVNKLNQYYNTLSGFNFDYLTYYQAFAWPNTVRHVEQIPGPAATDVIEIDTEAGTASVAVTDLTAKSWQVSCPPTAKCGTPENPWCPPTLPTDGGTSFLQACPVPDAGGVAPIGARLRFKLDRWGYMVPSSTLPGEPPLVAGEVATPNGRWNRVAVVAVAAAASTGCVAGCNSYDNFSFTLSQLGDYVASGFDQKERFLPLPRNAGQTPGGPLTVAMQLQAGSAYDTGNNVDPSSPLLNSYLRSDFVGLPLSGEYELILWPANAAYGGGLTQDVGRLTSIELVVEPYFWSVAPPVSP